MTMLCINDCIIDGLYFLCGNEYEIEFNPINNKMIIYNPSGYFTEIKKREIDKNFI